MGGGMHCRQTSLSFRVVCGSILFLLGFFKLIITYKKKKKN
jgi:hypothetical protein